MANQIATETFAKFTPSPPPLSSVPSSSSNPAFDRIVQKVCSILNDHVRWSPSLERSISSAVPNIHARLVFRVLKLQRNGDVAFGLFRWTSGRPNFRHNEFTYCALIEILGREKDFDRIWSLIHDMRQFKIQISPVPFTTLINSYGSSGLVDGAERAFKAMQDFCCEPNLHAYNALLNAQMQSQRTDEAFKTFCRMRAKGFTPDVVTYTTLITGLCKAGNTEKASDILKDMTNSGCAPNKLTYTAMIQGLLQADKGPEALSTLEIMSKNGCSPDAVTYNSLLEWCCEKEKLEKAMELLDQMTVISCEPNALTYNILINGFFKAGKSDLAIGMVKQMIEKRCIPDAAIYNLLSVWVCTKATSEQAITLLVWIVGACENCCGFSYVALMEKILKAQRADLVHATFKVMLVKGHTPDKTLCTAVINWLCKQGRTEEVVELLENFTGVQQAEPSISC